MSRCRGRDLPRLGRVEPEPQPLVTRVWRSVFQRPGRRDRRTCAGVGWVVAVVGRGLVRLRIGPKRGGGGRMGRSVNVLMCPSLSRCQRRGNGRGTGERDLAECPLQTGEFERPPDQSRDRRDRRGVRAESLGVCRGFDAGNGGESRKRDRVGRPGHRVGMFTGVGGWHDLGRTWRERFASVSESNEIRSPHDRNLECPSRSGPAAWRQVHTWGSSGDTGGTLREARRDRETQWTAERDAQRAPTRSPETPRRRPRSFPPSTDVEFGRSWNGLSKQGRAGRASADRKGFRSTSRTRSNRSIDDDVKTTIQEVFVFKVVTLPVHQSSRIRPPLALASSRVFSLAIAGRDLARPAQIPQQNDPSQSSPSSKSTQSIRNNTQRLSERAPREVNMTPQAGLPTRRDDLAGRRPPTPKTIFRGGFSRLRLR